MATIRENLITRAQNIAAELAALDSTKVGGLPNVSQADGGTAFDHQGYKKGLWDELFTLMEKLGISSLEELDAMETAESLHFETETQLELE